MQVDVTTVVSSAPTHPPAALRPAGASPFQITTDAEKISDVTDKTDGVLGRSFLRHFRRVTLDYVQHEAYFESWPVGKDRDRTGAFANAAATHFQRVDRLAITGGVAAETSDASFGASANASTVVDAFKRAFLYGQTGDLWNDGTFIAVNWANQPVSTLASAMPTSTSPGEVPVRSITRDGKQCVIWTDGQESLVLPIPSPKAN